MAVLQKQEAEIPLNGGMDTKQGAELQSVSTLRLVEDLRWNAAGELEKRPNVASTTTIASPGGIGVYAGLTAAALVESRGEVYTITDEYGAMNEAGDFVGGGGIDIDFGAYPIPSLLLPKACRVGRLTIDRCSGSDGDQGFETFASAVYLSTTLVTAAVVRIQDGSGCILRLQAMDIETGALLAQMQTDWPFVSNTSWAVDACEIVGGANPGVVVTFAWGAAAPYTIQVYRYRPATKDFTHDASLATTAANVKHRIKTSPTAGAFIIAYQASAAVLYAAQVTAGATSTLISAHAASHTAAGGVDIVVSGSKILIVSAGSGLGGAIYAERYGSGASYITLATLGGAELIMSITAARETASGNVDRAVLFASIYDGYYRMDTIMVNFTATTCAAVGSLNLAYRQCIANAWAVTHNDRAYVLASGGILVDDLSAMWLRHSQSYSGIAGTSKPIARVMHDVFADRRYGYTRNLLSAYVVGDTIYATLPADISADAMPNGSAALPQTVALSRVELAAKPLSYAQKDGVSTVASGVVFDLDGDAVTLSQPYCRPAISVVTSTVGTTTLATGCSIVAVYRWIDAAGREHRSAPSAAATTGAITNKQIDVHVAEMPFTPYQDTQGRTYSTDIYITEDGDSSYYLANTSGGNKLTSYTTGTGVRTFADVRVGVATNPPLYSTGDSDDELVSEPPPSFLAICTVGDRWDPLESTCRHASLSIL